MGPLSQHESHFPSLPFDLGDLHGIVGCGLVPHPGDDGGCGPVFDRDSFRPGDRATSDWGGMIGHGSGYSPGKVIVSGVECQESQHGRIEVFDVFGLGLIPASGIGIFAFRVSLGGSLGFKLRANLIDGRCRCPDAP